MAAENKQNEEQIEKKRTFADIQKMLLEDPDWELSAEDRAAIVPEVGWSVLDV